MVELSLVFTPWHIQVVPRPRAVGRPPRGVLHRAVRRRRRAVRRRVRRPLGAARWYQRPRRHRWRRRAAHAPAAEPELRRDATSRLAVHASRATTFVGAAARIFPGGPWPQARRSARGRRLRRGAVRLRGRTRGSWSLEDDGWRLLSHRAELSRCWPPRCLLGVDLEQPREMCVPLRAGWIAAGARSCDLRADQLVDPLVLEIPVRSDLTVPPPAHRYSNSDFVPIIIHTLGTPHVCDELRARLSRSRTSRSLAHQPLNQP